MHCAPFGRAKRDNKLSRFSPSANGLRAHSLQKKIGAARRPVIEKTGRERRAAPSDGPP